MSQRPRKPNLVTEEEREKLREWVSSLVEEAFSSDYITAQVDVGVRRIPSKPTDISFEYEHTGKRTLTLTWIKE